MYFDSNKQKHMEVSIHVGVIVVRTQFFVLIYEFILISPNNYIYKLQLSYLLDF